jgi:hypothetical protein
MNDQGERTGRAGMLPLLLGAMVIAGVGYYVFSTGIASAPPFIVLLLVGAVATVLHRLVERLRPAFDNILSQALSAVALMISMLAGIALVGWVLWVLFATDANPLNRFLAAKETPAQLASGFELALYLSLACLALIHAAALWTIVRTNAFGPKSDA